MEQERREEGSLVNRHVLIGSALIVVGLAFLSGYARGWEVTFWSSWWAVLLFAMGLVRFIDPGTRRGVPRSRRLGLWFMLLGVWGWISQNELFGLDYQTSWPLLVIGVGIITVWRAVEGPRWHGPARVKRMH